MLITSAAAFEASSIEIYELRPNRRRYRAASLPLTSCPQPNQKQKKSTIYQKTST